MGGAEVVEPRWALRRAVIGYRMEVASVMVVIVALTGRDEE